MMQIDDGVNGCRYWGYQLQSCSDGHDNKFSREERYAARDQYKVEVRFLKENGIQPSQYGLSKDKAILLAERIEKRFPNIRMKVFNHDYL